MNENKKNESLAGSPIVEPIAIVGMACRFPFANTVQEFWNLLANGKDTITEMPSERWNSDDYYDADLEADNKTNQRHASFLTNIHDFDPMFFNISPAEAIEMNPSQKLMLELVSETIESSSMPYDKVQGRKVGVYVGNIWNDFEHHRKHKNAAVTSHSAVGQSSNIIANRVSFTFGFSGPSLVVDTGCSSSLVALHLACQSLWDNSTEMSIVAGINHILDPDQYVLLSKFGGLSSKGRCSTFDKDGDGFVRGEGAGVLLLKKLSEAERNGDNILAVIRGTAMNNNGYNVNLPATSVEGQTQVLQDAYANSGISPDAIHYVEAHGTGTKLGDPTETKALGEFFKRNRKGDLHVGSVKTNIGHLEAAAGIAGLIKVVLAMQHKMLPPSLHFKNPNPNIDFKHLQLKVQSELSAWPVTHDETLKAGINSFGWGGTNAHTIIEEYKKKPAHTKEPPRTETLSLPLSAKSFGALSAYAKNYLAALEGTTDQQFNELCIATALRKPSLSHRALFSGKSKSEIQQGLESFLSQTEDGFSPRHLSAKDKVVMIFPGQGSQWLGMGRELFEQQPAFRGVIQSFDSILRQYANWSLIDQLFASSENSRLNEIDVIQPMLCAVQIAIAKLWISWGVKPDAIVGHSMGEVSAAYISGAINLSDAVKIICTRSSLMKTVSGKGGAMAVTELSVQQAEEIIKRYPELSVAVSNSPKSTVMAGDEKSIQKLLTELESKGLFGRQVKVDVASHSQQMEPLKQDLHKALSDLTPGSSATPMFSTVLGREVKGNELNADYWVGNLRQTVQFATVIEQLLSNDHVIFIEASPHPVLVNAITECAEALQKKAVTIASVYREKPESESIAKNLGELYCQGYDVDWKTFYKTTQAPAITLPTYPFQRERFELEDRSSEVLSNKSGAKFPLLGNAIHLANNEGTHYWETQLSLATFPYMADHLVNDTPVLPGAAYVEMLLEAVTELFGTCSPQISKLRFVKSVSLSKGEVSTVQLKINERDNNRSFIFYARVIDQAGKATWETLADGDLKISPRKQDTNSKYLEQNSGGFAYASDYYEALKSLGLHYGNYFRRLENLVKVESPFGVDVQFNLSVNEAIALSAKKYKIHPAILDSCFQPLFMSVVAGDQNQNGRTTFLTEVGEFQWLGEFDAYEKLSGVARLHPLKKDEHRGFVNVEADVVVYKENGEVLFKVNGLKGKVIETNRIEERKEKLKDWLYKINWLRADTLPAAQHEQDKSSWVVFGDPYGVSEILVEKLRRSNFNPIHVTPGNNFMKMSPDRYAINYGRELDYKTLLADLFNESSDKISGIIHFGSMSYTWQDPDLTADVVEQHQLYGSISFMHLHQQLAALNLQRAPRLVIVTNGIQHTKHDQEFVQPVHSPLWGIAKVMFNELTHYNCRYFDLSANPSMEELDQVVSHISAPASKEHEVAFRGTYRYVPRLSAHIDEEKHENVTRQFSSTGTYLVTGYRGLGFVFVEWMIRQGARNFALLSRTGEVTDDLRERMSALKSQGVLMRVFKADAGRYEQIKHVVDQIDETMPALRGVIHAAGIIEARTLTELNQSEFLRILNPKVKGAWNLHLLTQHKTLDCFIMFSSASTLIGLSGQGSYVAANAFLDTLAFTRKQMGLPGMSINWGVMKDVGMVANKAELEKYARAEGFEPVSMHEAMDVFHAIYDSEHTQIGIVKLHPETMANYYSALSQTPYFKGLLGKENVVKTKEAGLLDKLAQLQNAEQRTTLVAQVVTELVSKIVKTQPSRIKPAMTFKSLGVDSLMAIQLRNLLEKQVSLKLSVAMFWAHPSIGEYAAFLTNALAEQILIKTMEGDTRKAKPANPAHWFVTPKPNANATIRLFCFHDAGGNSSLYHPWIDKFSDQIEMVSVELPGRGRRMSEQPYSETRALLDDLRQAITPLLDKPFVFFGHSMGGMLAFELTRELRSSRMPLPIRLFVSSTPGLTTYSQREVNPHQTDDELIAMFPYLKKEAIADDELHKLLMDLMRVDLTLLSNYRYQKQEALQLPIIVLHGESDERVKSEQAENWCDETTHQCIVITRPGGHRYIDGDTEFLTTLISNSISEITVNKNFIL